MSPLIRAAVGLLALAALAGCASTTMTSHDTYEGPALNRPDRIIIEDFAATPEEVPADFALTAEAAAPAAQTAEEIEIGHKLGAEVAEQLVANLRRRACRPSGRWVSRHRGLATS